MSELEAIAQDITGYLERHARKSILRLLTAGSVDDGKSTLIGRLLHDSKMVFEDQLAALQRDSAKGSAGGEIDYSLLVDGLISEREQGITIDVAYRYFSTVRRKFIIADTPGHEQYTRNMATGASTADLAVILVDARQGMLAQTRRHSFIASLLGIRHVVVAVNKMDLVGYDRAVFEAIRAEYGVFSAGLGFGDVQYIPLSALRGDNVVSRSDALSWYEGPPLLEHLETVPIAEDTNLTDLRFPVQHVVRPNLDFRGFAGTIASGIVRRGDELVALPSGQRSRVKSIVTYDGELEEAFAPMAVTVTLEDERDVGRGDMLVRSDAQPVVGRSVDAMVVWMHDRPLRAGASYLIKHGTRVVSAEVVALHHRVDVNTLAKLPAEQLGLNDIGRVTLVAARPLLFDPYRVNRATGALILIDRLTNATVGAAMIEGPGTVEAPAAREGLGGAVTAEERARRIGQRAATVWLEGDGVAGHVARGIERRLFDEGYLAHVVDAAALGLREDAEDLGVRALEVARVCLGAGLITVIVASHQGGVGAEKARAALGATRFASAVVNASDDPEIAAERVYNELRAGGALR